MRSGQRWRLQSQTHLSPFNGAATFWLHHFGKVAKGLYMLWNHRSKLPSSSRHNTNRMHELSHNKRSQLGTCCWHQKLTGRIWEGPKRRRLQPVTVLSSNSHTRIFLGREMNTPPGRTLSQIKYGCKQDDWTDTIWKANPTTINPETANHLAKQISWVPLLCYTFPIKSSASSVRVSPPDSFPKC